jgi:hypothetical protein
MRRLLALAAGLLLLACSSTGPSQRVSLSISTQSSTTTVGSDVLVINKAEIILRKVELEGQTDGCVSDGPALSGPLADSENDDDDGEGEAECEEFKAGPFRFELPLNALEAVVTVDIPAGSYEEVEFQIHKVNPNDAGFAAANPDFVGKSIRVEGTFNGQPFVFESDLTAEQEVDLEPPLVVTGETSTNLTIRVDLSTWFKTDAGLLINPATANSGDINEQLVKQNIKRSFHAFEDRDRDGEDDD